MRARFGWPLRISRVLNYSSDIQQVLEQCVGIHSIILQRLKQATESQINCWGHVIFGSIRVCKAGFDQSRLHKLIHSKQQADSDHGLGQALVPLDNLYQACYELLSETFALLSVVLDRSNMQNMDGSKLHEEICDEIVPLCQDLKLRYSGIIAPSHRGCIFLTFLFRMSVKNVLWRAFIPFCTNPALSSLDCRWNRLKVVISLLSEVSEQTQKMLISVTLHSPFFSLSHCIFVGRFDRLK